MAVEPNTLELVAVSNRRSDFGTSPFYEEVGDRKIILHVDSDRFEVCRLDPETKETESVNMGEKDGIVNWAVPYKFDRNYILVGREKKIQRLKWDTREILDMAIVEEDKPDRIMCRGAKCDRRGRLYFGTQLIDINHRVRKEGYIYWIDVRMRITKCEGVALFGPAGMAWHFEKGIMYCADSWHQEIVAFDYNDKDGSLSNQRVAVVKGGNFNFSTPWDVVTTEQGDLWALAYREGDQNYVRISLLAMPSTKYVKGITSYRKMTGLCFGRGPSKFFDELYITTSRRNPNESEVSTNDESNDEEDGVMIKAFKLESMGFPLQPFGS